MTRRLMALAMVGLFASVAGCAVSQPTSTPTVEVTPTPGVTPAPAAGTAPFHAIPADSVFVSGTASCSFSGGPEAMVAFCTLDMSDPRVSGFERQSDWRVVIESGQPQGTLWVADTLTITNDGGTWHGSAQATDTDTYGTLLEAHYFGDGAYEGLEFHYYTGGSCEEGVDGVIEGWISGGG